MPAMLGMPRPRAYMPSRPWHCKPLARHQGEAGPHLVNGVGFGAKQGP
jgi:hypothetical protein